MNPLFKFSITNSEQKLCHSRMPEKQNGEKITIIALVYYTSCQNLKFNPSLNNEIKTNDFY